EVEQEFAGRVHVGQEAVIQDDTTAGPRWHGRVIRRADWYTQRRSVSPEPVQFTDVRTLEIIVDLEPDQAPLSIGQRVRVTLGPVSAPLGSRQPVAPHRRPPVSRPSRTLSGLELVQ